MILENENTFLGGLMEDAKQIAGAIAGVALITAFFGLLIAPALEPLICGDMIQKACGSGTLEEIKIADRQLKSTRIILWVICVLTWVIALLILSGFNLSNH